MVSLEHLIVANMLCLVMCHYLLCSGHKCWLVMTSEFLENHCNSSCPINTEFSHFFFKMLYLYKIETRIICNTFIWQFWKPLGASVLHSSFCNTFHCFCYILGSCFIWLQSIYYVQRVTIPCQVSYELRSPNSFSIYLDTCSWMSWATSVTLIPTWLPAFHGHRS